MSPTPPPSSGTPIPPASFWAKMLNRVQIFALRHPHNILAQLLLPMISLIEGLLANNPTYLDKQRLMFGPHFCCAGQVVMGEFQALEQAITSPQARTWRLGTSVLESHHLPNVDLGSRTVFLLALSDQGAGGDGAHAAFRQCMETYLMNEAAIARQGDETARQLLEQLATDYQDMPHGLGGSFFDDPSRGLMRFMVCYLHYVLFGLDPQDQPSMNLLAQLYYSTGGTKYYFAGLGKVLQVLNVSGARAWPQLIQQAAAIYEASPALVDFQEGNPDFHNMTKGELARLMTSIMSIAALQGPLHLAYTAMGYRLLPAYTGQKTAEIDPTQIWDQLDLEDHEALKGYLLECARLWMPVSASHRVAVEPFTVKMMNKEYTFPAGTKVLIPMILGMLDRHFWGSTVYEFNAQRENLCPYHMGFNAVGDRSNGRICPGRDIALNMLIDMLRAIGQVRRAAYASAQSP